MKKAIVIVASILFATAANSTDYAFEGFPECLPPEGVLTITEGQFTLTETTCFQISRRTTDEEDFKEALYECEGEGEPLGETRIKIRTTPTDAVVIPMDGNVFIEDLVMVFNKCLSTK